MLWDTLNQLLAFYKVSSGWDLNDVGNGIWVIGVYTYRSIKKMNSKLQRMFLQKMSPVVGEGKIVISHGQN